MYGTDRLDGLDRLGQVGRWLGFVAGVAVFGVLVVWGPLAGGDVAAPFRSKPAAAPSATPTVPVLPPAPPDLLAIPRLGVQARVVAVPLGVGRTLLPPQHPRLVGWWSGSAAPGGVRGGTVIAGHTVHTGGGALDRLHELSTGDRIDLRTANGRMRYRVDRTLTLRKSELAAAADELFDQGSPARLVVVTCDDWDGRAYRSNVVAVASPIRATPARQRDRLDG